MVDLASGVILSEVSAGGTIHDLGIEGDKLYVLLPTQLRAYDLTQIPPLFLGSVAVSANPAEGITAKKRLFVGGGIAYVSVYYGHETFTVTNTASMQRIGVAVDRGFNSFKQIILNGSGLGVAAVGVNPVNDGTHDISLYNESSPAVTTNFLTTFVTPGLARAVALYNGLAYAADGDAGLTVINYLALDTAGSAPTASLKTSFAMNSY